MGTTTQDRAFRFEGEFTPQGDQGAAIDALVAGVARGDAHQCLLGVTGSGKTFTIAKVVEALNRPTLVMAHNKTLAAQLYGEFRRFFPANAVEYFVSYYDYYQPEAYIPNTDTYIEKDALVNDEIDKLRHRATRALLERRDVIIVASVSCIYGLGSPDSYHRMSVVLETGMKVKRQELLRKLVDVQYARNEMDLRRGTFRVRGDVIEIQPASEDVAIRVDMWGDEVEGLSMVDPLRAKVIEKMDRVVIYPKSHYVTPEVMLKHALGTIQEELNARTDELTRNDKLLEAQRLQQRTMFDLEMLREVGSCHGIENYSRHLTGRAPGEPPPTLIEYLPDDALVVVDESHQTVPQIGGMYRGDRSRKETLVNFGFRLPSALDNRPLKFEEWEQSVRQVIFVSATPGPYELEHTGGVVVEQMVRPTGLVDPEVRLRPVRGQVDDLLAEIRGRAAVNERVLVTTLTKRMAEELTSYYADLGIRVRYLHSEVDTLERTEILRDLRAGKFDVLVGINLLREGLDLPEVSLVAVLDADKEGFLRSTTSLVQTAGRAARNLRGEVIFYADKVTESMKQALSEMDRRRRAQLQYNVDHGITPASVKKALEDSFGQICEMDYVTVPVDTGGRRGAQERYTSMADLEAEMARVEAEMHGAAQALEFERAADLRDRLRHLQSIEIFS